MKWTIKHIKTIERNIHLTDSEIAKLLGVGKHNVCTARKRYGIIKTTNAGWFKQGLKPWNKGIDFKAGGRSVETQFKKGQQPANAFRNIGDVFTIKDGTGKLYKFIKLPHNRQYPYGRYVYEQSTGIKLTNDQIITYKDGDPQNCSIENLKMITRRENALRNANREKAARSMRKRKTLMLAHLKTYGITDKRKRA